MRHGVDALSKRAAEVHIKRNGPESDGLRDVMCLLSAHTPETSDAVYGRETDAVYLMGSHQSEKFR
jgi:hypothetical protein